MQMSIKRHPKFKREGQDIISEEEIPYTDAILGGVVAVDTVDGKEDLRIPAGAQPFQRLRLKGKGVPKLGGGPRGDAYVTLKVRKLLRPTVLPGLTLCCCAGENPNEYLCRGKTAGGEDCRTKSD